MTDQATITLTSSSGLPPQRRSFLGLPREILGLIIDALAQHDRTSLVRTCRYMQKLVEPLLYRHLRTAKGPRCHTFYYERLFITLTERPELIQHARSYRGRLTPSYLGKDEQQRTQCLGSPGLERLLMVAERIEISTTIFTQAINIRDIHLTGDASWYPEDSLQPVWQTLLHKKLERLSIDYFDHLTPITALLRAQMGLKKLAIFSNTTGWEDLEGAHLPLLEHLTCTAVQAASIVPGRPVGRLELQGRDDHENVLGEELFKQLARSAGPIVEFIMRFPFKAKTGIFQRTLQFISCHLPHIKSLTITVNGFISRKVLLGEIPSFKSLKRLHLRETRLWEIKMEEGTQEVTGLEYEEVSKRAKELCPTLVELKFSDMRLLNWPIVSIKINREKISPLAMSIT